MLSWRICLGRPALLATPLPSNSSPELHGPRHLRWRIMQQRKPYGAIRDEDELSGVLEPVHHIRPKHDEEEEEEKEEELSIDFSRPQPSHSDVSRPRREFADLVAREAFLDEEFWTAAWLRAESHWEHQPHDRYTNNSKRKFAEQEFHAIKRRVSKHHVQRCSCIVTVKKEDSEHHANRTEECCRNARFKHPERIKPPLFCGIQKSASNRYGYISNLCVTKLARRKGIATNMLLFAVESAKSQGVEEVFVHVYRDNAAAQLLYQKIGFEIIENASPQLVEDKMYLLCCKV